MADKLPKNTTELLAQIKGEWTQLLGVAAQLTPEQMTTPDSGGWSPKDNLAHLAAWMHFMQECYLGNKPAHEAMGIDAAVYEGLSEDAVNAILFERNRDRPAADVLDELKRTYTEVAEILQKMPYPDLRKTLRVDDPEKRPVMFWVLANTSEHFLEHRRSIEKML